MADCSEDEPAVGLRGGSRAAGAAIAIVAFSIALVATTLSLIDASPRMLFADPAASTGQPAHLGLFSALSVMGWTAGASIAALGMTLVHPRAKLLCGSLAMFTLWLALDDQFMLHESVGPSAGVPQKAFLALYAIVATAIAVAFRSQLARGSWLLAATSLVMLGLSVAIDVASDRSIYFAAPWMIVIEDGAKLTGIMLWVAYLGGLVRAWVVRPIPA